MFASIISFLGLRGIVIVLAVLTVGTWFTAKMIESYNKGFKSGEKHVITEVAKDTKKVKNAWKKIDTRNIGTDAAIGELRDLSRKQYSY